VRNVLGIIVLVLSIGAALGTLHTRADAQTCKDNCVTGEIQEGFCPDGKLLCLADPNAPTPMPTYYTIPTLTLTPTPKPLNPTPSSTPTRPASTPTPTRTSGTSNPTPTAPATTTTTVSQTTSGGSTGFQIVSVTPPEGLSCIGTRSQSPAGARDFPKSGESIGERPVVFGTDTSGGWGQGCVRSWCANGRVYTRLDYSRGYADAVAPTSFKIDFLTPSGPAGNLTTTANSVTIDMGNQTTAASKFYGLKISNGYYTLGVPEYGYPTTDFTTSNCQNQTTSPSPTGQPSGNVTGKTAVIYVAFEGIDALNNTRPIVKTRPISLWFYPFGSPDFSKQPVKKVDGIVTLDSTIPATDKTFGLFLNPAFSIGDIPAGDYYVLIKTPNSLRALTNPQSPVTVTSANTPITITYTTPLPMGDINGDNIVDIRDYDLWRITYKCANTIGSLTTACSDALTDKDNTSLKYFDATIGLFSDLDLRGSVGLVPGNIILRRFLEQGR